MRSLKRLDVDNMTLIAIVRHTILKVFFSQKFGNWDSNLKSRTSFVIPMSYI